MNLFEATMIAESEFELAGHDPETISADTVIEAWQMLVDTGVVWSLQGRLGRAAMAMIQSGTLHA